MHEGILLIAYIARRLSANKQMRSIAVDEMFANMVFRVSFGYGELPTIRVAYRHLALPY